MALYVTGVPIETKWQMSVATSVVSLIAPSLLMFNLSLCAFYRFTPNALSRLFILCRLVNCGLHPHASFLELCLLLRGQILPLFELLKCVFRIGAQLSRA